MSRRSVSGKMDLRVAQHLCRPGATDLIAAATARQPTDASLLADLTALRREYSPELAAAALELVMLRRRAAAKFSRADRMFFTRPALEQASGECIATYRAQRYRRIGAQRVADLGCGIGGDALALAAHGVVLGVDLDPVRLVLARENCRVYGREDRFQPLLADLSAWRPAGVDALFFDPARRRADGRRIHSVKGYHPPLSIIERWLPRVPNLGVKISPAVDYEELPPQAEVEFISEAGTVKEAALWFGELRTDAGRRATLLPAGETLTDEEMPDSIPLSEPRAFLYEPDGAVIRAHLVAVLAARLNASQLDPDIAYLTADTLVSTPFARAFQIEEYHPFQLKRLRARLRELKVGRVVIKKRGSPLDPADLARRLRLQGDEERILFLTHLDGKPVVLIGWPVGQGSGNSHSTIEERLVF